LLVDEDVKQSKSVEVGAKLVWSACDSSTTREWCH